MDNKPVEHVTVQVLGQFDVALANGLACFGNKLLTDIKGDLKRISEKSFSELTKNEVLGICDKISEYRGALLFVRNTSDAMPASINENASVIEKDLLSVKAKLTSLLVLIG